MSKNNITVEKKETLVEITVPGHAASEFTQAIERLGEVERTVGEAKNSAEKSAGLASDAKAEAERLAREAGDYASDAQGLAKSAGDFARAANQSAINAGKALTGANEAKTEAIKAQEATAKDAEQTGKDAQLTTENLQRLLNELANYLPTTGGTLTGKLKVKTVNNGCVDVGGGYLSARIGAEDGNESRGANLNLIAGRSKGVPFDNVPSIWYLQGYAREDNFTSRILGLTPDGRLTFGKEVGTYLNPDVLVAGSQYLPEAKQIKVCSNIGASRVHAQGDGWTQYEDGKMECAFGFTKQLTLNTPTANGALFQSEEFEIPFPVPFKTLVSALPICNRNANGVNAWVCYSRLLSVEKITVVRIISTNRVNNPFDYFFSVEAKGTWK